jgi:hypothetical protein
MTRKLGFCDWGIGSACRRVGTPRRYPELHDKYLFGVIEQVASSS